MSLPEGPLRQKDALHPAYTATLRKTKTYHHHEPETSCHKSRGLREVEAFGFGSTQREVLRRADEEAKQEPGRGSSTA